MERGAGLMIGLSALAVVVVCGGLGGAGFYVVSRRAGEREAEAQARAVVEQAEAEARRAAIEAQMREEMARAQAASDRAQAEVARARAEAEAAARAHDPLADLAERERTRAATQVVREVSPRLRRCYETALRAHAGATVRARMTLVWGPDGALRSARVTELSADPAGADTPELRACLEQVYAGTTVPTGPDELTVQMPVVFQAS